MIIDTDQSGSARENNKHIFLMKRSLNTPRGATEPLSLRSPVLDEIYDTLYFVFFCKGIYDLQTIREVL